MISDKHFILVDEITNAAVCGIEYIVSDFVRGVFTFPESGVRSFT